MAAPKGNQFWKLRSRHGSKKLFRDSKLLWEACCEYFQWIDENPLIQIDFKGKDADKVHIPHTRPYTKQGLCSYLGVNTLYFRDFKERLEKKKDKQSKDFALIITHIEEIIYEQKFSGAAVGFYNANIIARDLGLVDKTDSKLALAGKASVSYTFGDNLPDE